MSVIAIHRVPPKWTLQMVMKKLAPIIAGHFETLNFATGRTKIGLKTCYLRLSERLDPQHVVEKINDIKFSVKTGLKASIPKTVPDLPLAAKPKTIPQKLARALKIRLEYTPDKVLVLTHNEILTELQSKFTRLFNLSRKFTNHQLLDNIARAVFDRLYNIMQSNPEVSTNCFKLTQTYRRLHPHFGDFQFVLSTLQALPDVKVPEITEKDLSVVTAEPYSIDSIPYDKVQLFTNKYSVKITKSVLQHIRNLPSEEDPTDNEEEVARKKVRQELKNLTPYLPSIIRQVILKHLTPEKTPFHRIRIYGEPFLPSKELMSPFVRRYHAVKVTRSDWMFNLLKLTIPPQHFASLITMDGTVVGGAKLVIRSSDIPLYKATPGLVTEMKAAFGVKHVAEEEDAHSEEGEGEEMEVEQ